LTGVVIWKRKCVQISARVFPNVNILGGLIFVLAIEVFVYGDRSVALVGSSNNSCYW